jgi:hypothetical protein
MEDRDGRARRWNGARSPPPKRLRVRRQYDPGAPVALSASTSQFQCDDATPGSARHATAHFAPTGRGVPPLNPHHPTRCFLGLSHGTHSLHGPKERTTAKPERRQDGEATGSTRWAVE